jgi:PhnB protein
MTTSPVPAGHNAVSPYLVVQDAERLIAFLERTFGATAISKMKMPGGGIHAEVRIADSIVMIGQSPRESSPAMVHCYVPDVDATFAAALAAGATAIRKPETMFYGDRISMVADPQGHQWAISTHLEDVSEDEAARRMASKAP